MSGPLLELQDLQVGFDTGRKVIHPVRGVSLAIYPGQTVALVGESGCGKSVSALSILRLIPQPPGRYTGGRIMFDGRDLLKLSQREMRAVRGREIAMIFQEPMTSLNPVYTVGDQIMEAVVLHQRVNTRRAREIAEQSLRDVGIADPARRLDEYPHQLSGGMRQRVMIAMALSCQPRLLIADEPTTALDVTIQAQILELLRHLQQTRNMAMLLITHDLGVVAENADVVNVMYAGRIVESAGVEELFDHPLHPYTQGLFRSLPRLGHKTVRLQTIEGMVPSPAHWPPGCKFHPRCHLTRELAARAKDDETVTINADDGPVRVMRRCVQVMQDLPTSAEPDLRQVGVDHWAACHYVDHYVGGAITPPVLNHQRQVVHQTGAVHE